MQDLRLVGVHDDGEHLLLSGAGGEMFQLPIDEALRAASRSSAKAAARRAARCHVPAGYPGADPQRCHRRGGRRTFRAAPCQGRAVRRPGARRTRVRGPAGPEDRGGLALRPVTTSTVPLSATTRRPSTTWSSHRLTAHGIEPSAVEWDSWRRPDGSWTVAARFEAKKDGTAGIGEEPPALWTFSPARKSLQNANRWAQQLSELEPLDGPVPARRLSAVSDRPFDFETDAEAAARHSPARTRDRMPSSRPARTPTDCSTCSVHAAASGWVWTRTPTTPSPCSSPTVFRRPIRGLRK